MKARLVSYTKPVDTLTSEGVESIQEFIAFVARVSNPANQFNSLTASKLVDYLRTHRHWSPFEMVDVTVEITPTRDIGRQILRHRSFTFQEFSQRYADVRALGEMFEFSEARLQDDKNRQGSVATNDVAIQNKWHDYQERVAALSKEAYEWALSEDVKIAKEVARKVLPEGLTLSRMYMKGSIRSWIHYLEVRGPNSGTQKEHTEIAAAILQVLSEIFPKENLQKDVQNIST